MRQSLLPLAVLALLAGAAACSSSDDNGPDTPDSGTPDPGTPEEPAVPERTACTGLTEGPGTHTYTVQHAGRTRTYRVHVPPGYDATKPTPTVLGFHGFGSNMEEQEGLSGLSTLADTEGFIAVYPQGLSVQEVTGRGEPEAQRSWNGGACCGPAQIYAVDDVGFIDALFADLDTRVCVDTKRTYAMGFSNGGFMSYRLACERARRFAAVAPVAGMEGADPCNPSRPVAVLHVHGTDDGTILYAGGNNVPFGRPYPSAEESVRRWSERNQCTGPRLETYRQGIVTCTAYTGCNPETATASLCTVQGGLHAWPGYPDFNNGTRDMNATQEAWRFFKDRPRP